MKILMRKKLWVSTILLAGLLVVTRVSPAAAAYLTDPAATVTQSGNVVTLRKELGGYGNYGPGGADILYSGEGASWLFDLAGAGVDPATVQQAEVRAGLVLDDHYGVPSSSYSGSIQVGSTTLFSGPWGLGHGSPFGQQFGNWQTLSFSASNPVGNVGLVGISNTSSAGGGDWIAIDWIELKVTVQLDQDSDGVSDANDDCPSVAGDPHYDGCPIKRYDVLFMTFIPSNYIDASILSRVFPLPVPTRYLPAGTTCVNPNIGKPSILIGAGDDRGFNPTAATSPGKPFKTLQRATIVMVDKSPKEFFLEQPFKDIGPSKSYVKDQANNGGALNHGLLGRIDPLDDDGLNDCYLKHQEATASNASIEMPFKEDVNANTSRLRLKGSAANALIPNSPAIYWDINVDLDTSNSSSTLVTVSGTRVEFPAYEIYINNQPVYQNAPGGLGAAQLPVLRFGALDLTGLYFGTGIPDIQTTLSN